jgi:hypothetical protein
VVAGLQGLKVKEYERSSACVVWEDVEASGSAGVQLPLNGRHNITFSMQDMLLEPHIVNPSHTNCMILRTEFAGGGSFERTFLSSGGEVFRNWTVELKKNSRIR